MSRRRDYRPPDAEPTDHELVTQLKRLRYDLTEMQGKVSEALRMAGALKLEAAPPHLCPECKQAGITHDLRTATKLANHRHYSHGIDVDPPGTCPDCGVSTTNGHAADCPTLEPA